MICHTFASSKWRSADSPMVDVVSLRFGTLRVAAEAPDGASSLGSTSVIGNSKGASAPSLWSYWPNRAYFYPTPKKEVCV